MTEKDAVATAETISEQRMKRAMSIVIVPLMDTESDMSNALNIGADDGRKTENGMVMGMNNALYHLCRHSVSIMDGWIPMPSTALSQVLGESLYKTRKKLKSLKEQGLVQSVRYCNVTEDGNYLISGYEITEKAKSTPAYEIAWNEERKLCKECFGIDIGEVGYDPYKELFGEDFCSYGERRTDV